MPGAKTGLCIPRSPAHCASCASDADCGSLSERCIAGPGDTAPACHVDCALAGADACPPDYACTPVKDGNATRSLCVPKPVAGQPVACLDSLGGWCDRIAAPQDCVRTNCAGTCTGQRVCIVQSKRFDKCGALAPQFKMDCNQQDPAGCTEAYAPGVLSTIQNCGACGHACAGQTNTSDAQCTNGKCDMTCRGDDYDVDGSAANGCEIADEVPPGHTQQTAASLGNTTCNDTTSMNTFSAHVPSDARVHTNPTVTVFSGVVGAAPDWWSVFSSGGLCVDNYAVTFTTSGGGNTQCYRCTIQTNIMSQSVTVSGSGSGTMSSGSGSYSDNSTIYFKIEKTCSLPVQENVKYTVSYHL
jgi:hypothetical protein